jgi:predicted outer membrane repeat protein
MKKLSFLDVLFLSSCFNLYTFCFGNRYFSSHSMRMLSTDIEKQLSSGFSAIIISGISTFTLTNVQITNSNCLSELCLGGALAISNSNGIISSSYFANNHCKSNGGAIGMVNLNGNTTISKTTITNNTSSNGNGGGISSTSSLNSFLLTIS